MSAECWVKQSMCTLRQLFRYFYQFTTVFHSREQGGPAAWLHAHAILLKELSSDQPKVHSRLKNQLHTVQLFTIGVIKLITTVETKKSSSFQHPGDKLVQLKFHTKTTLTKWVSILSKGAIILITWFLSRRSKR